MDARRLTRALVLEAPVERPDGAGGHQRDWQALGTLWADMRASSGRGTKGEGVGIGLVRWRIALRAAPPGAPSRPRAGQRFREGERVFETLTVSEADRGGRWLTCMAREETVR